MIGRKRIFRVLAVLFVAVSAGELVETLRPTAVSARLEAAALVRPAELATSVAQGLPDSASLSAGQDAGMPRLTGITPVAGTARERGAQSCEVTLGLAASPGAMIDVLLAAPCNRGERVVIRHSGLSFTAMTNVDGRLRLQIPALSADALVAAYFDSSEIALAKVAIPDAASHARFAVQMALPAQFDLRADEGGQVFSGNGGGSADSGFRKILTLGTLKVAQPMLAQVYTLPQGDADLADVTVELKITPETCGRTLPAEAILARNGTVTARLLQVSVPLCGTSGDILLLKNLLHDLKLAAPE